MGCARAWSASLKTAPCWRPLAAAAWGVFPAALSVQDDLLQRHQARLLGPCAGVDDNYYAISTERKVKHPVVQQLLAQG